MKKAVEGAQSCRWVVTAYVRPFQRGYDLYSRYYREALRLGSSVLGGRYDEVAPGRFPALMRIFRRTRDA